MNAQRPDEVDDEVRFHLERRTDELVAQGWPRDEAEAEARRRFGNVDRVKRGMRRMRRKKERRTRVGLLREALSQDLSYALRGLRKNPVFTVVVTLTLALGIGVNTAIFSVVDGILFRPLPFPEPEELVVLWSDVTQRGGPADEWLSFTNFRDLRDQTPALEAAAAWGGWTPTWSDTEEPQQLLGAQVAEGMMSEVLRVAPEAGRSFRPEEHLPGAPGRVLLSYGFWDRAFGRDLGVIGSTLTLMDRPFEVVGVMPEGFRPPFLPGADLWAPLLVPEDVEGARGGFYLRAIGRLAPGVSLTRAGSEVAALGSRLAAAYPETNTGMTFRAVPLRDDLVSETRTGLLVLLGAVGLMLLVACVNVANLLVARASARTQELGVRSALGAARGRIVGQLLTESLVLAALGGLLGVVLAYWGTDLLVALAPEGTPRLDEVRVDGRVLAFTGVVTAAAGVLFGLVPAWRVARTDLHLDLREGARSGVSGLAGRLRSGLVVAQVALAMMLMFGAGLLVRSFQHLRATDLGFEPADVVTLQVNLPPARYPDRGTLRAFTDDLDARLSAIPGVEATGLASTLPLIGFDEDVTIVVEGRALPEPGQEVGIWLRRVSPGYIDAMRMRLSEGRGFTRSDGPDDLPVVVLNETAATRLFPSENPIGRRVNVNSPANPVWREVVGVVRDVRHFGVRESARNAMYVPASQLPARTYFVVARVAGEPGAVIPAVRSAVTALDPGLAVPGARTMDEIVRASVAPERFVAFLLGLFAVVSLLLAVIGLYGVVAYDVATRVREMGLRMALGAGGGVISGMVIGRSLALVAAGVAIGATGAALLGGVVDGLLFGVGRFDPLTLGVVATVLSLSAAVAAAFPALRAARVDPAVALRSD